MTPYTLLNVFLHSQYKNRPYFDINGVYLNNYFYINKILFSKKIKRTAASFGATYGGWNREKVLRVET